MRETPSARRVKNKARVGRYEKLKAERASLQAYTTGRVILPAGPRLGKSVLELQNVSKGYAVEGEAERRMLLKNTTLSIPGGSVVGVVGPNGCGKTTLFRMLVGDESPDEGAVVVGSTVKMGHVTQSRQNLDPENTLLEEVSGGQDFLDGVEGEKIHFRHYLTSFNFRGDQLGKPVRFLSGGERNRVHLAKSLKNGYNVILLDEPTNDLDVETLRSLEEALPEVPGVAVIISHDRYFLDKVCTHIVAFEGNGVVRFYPGCYSDYLSSHASGKEGVQYKKLYHF